MLYFLYLCTIVNRCICITSIAPLYSKRWTTSCWEHATNHFTETIWTLQSTLRHTLRHKVSVFEVNGLSWTRRKNAASTTVMLLSFHVESRDACQGIRGTREMQLYSAFVKASERKNSTFTLHNILYINLL